MPSVEKNREQWDAKYEWAEAGDEWSVWWGTPEAQWRWTLLPRIQSFVPAPTILEIAPGYGRWTQYLRTLCDRLLLVDLSARCIEKCQERFAGDAHISYFVNDGKSLAMIPDGSVDFVFSFDSLVHAEADVIESYLAQLARKLTPDGVGFIHHSNWGAYRSYLAVTDRIRHGKGLLVRAGVVDPELHWRARSMSAELFERYARAAGLQCVGQELVNWGIKRLCDAFSVFALPTSRWARRNTVLRNPKFMEEAAYARGLAASYVTMGRHAVGGVGVRAVAS